MKYRVKNTMGQERPKWVDNVQKVKLFGVIGLIAFLGFHLIKDIRKRGI